MSDPLGLLQTLKGFESSRVVRRLGQGPVSDSWLLTGDGEKFVVRQDRPLAASLGLDREQEWRVLQWAWGCGLGPEPVLRQAGVLVTRYLHGGAADQTAASGLDTWRRVGRLLRRLHDAPGMEADQIDVAATAHRYAMVAGSTEARSLSDRISQRSRMLYTDVPWRPCHHDPHLGNLVGGSNWHLVDWEYAALGHCYFDLAVVIRYHHLKEESREALLAAWGDGQSVDMLLLEEFLELYDELSALWSLAVSPELA